MPRTYAFAEDWLLPYAPEQVGALLADLEGYPGWWPQVRRVERVDDERGWVTARSTLPYPVRLLLTREREDAQVLRTRLAGDLVGWAEFRLAPVAAGCVVAYRQEVVLGSGLLDALTRPLGLLLRWNHARMMAGCRRGLEAALRSR